MGSTNDYFSKSDFDCYFDIRTYNIWTNSDLEITIVMYKSLNLLRK